MPTVENTPIWKPKPATGKLFFVQIWIAKSSGFAGHVVSVATTYFCFGISKAATDKMQMSTHDYPPIQLYLLLRHKEEQNISICSNMDRLGGHYPKWSKSDRDWQILYDMCEI